MDVLTSPGAALVCTGCSAEVSAGEPMPFRCPAARPGDDVDHVLRRLPDPAVAGFPSGSEENPFVRYRRLFLAHRVALATGLSDDDYVSLVEDLDERVSAVDGRGFRITPFAREARLSDAVGLSDPGGVWVKDETGNVSGSHKARHLMGLLIWLAVAERTGRAPAEPRPLAIASCGNAALAAAVVARAADRRLDVFVPTWADPAIVRRLKELGAEVEVCVRDDAPGDPTYHRLRRAVAEGALPFTCQGPDNALTIEGGRTIGYEIADELRRADAGLDRIAIQIGGGALASAVIQGLEEAAALGALEAMPVVDAVQSEGAAPLARAFRMVARRIEEGEGLEAALAWAARHRSSVMWPWESEPRSVADGILDDETYDWVGVVRGMLATGGRPRVVSEDLLREANDLAGRTTEVDADHTGTAGLAGLLAARRARDVGPAERVAVLFTGVRRSSDEDDTDGR